MATTLAPTANVSMMNRRPVADVYRAFVDPEVTTKFWFTKSTGRLDERKHVRWDWERLATFFEQRNYTNVRGVVPLRILSTLTAATSTPLTSPRSYHGVRVIAWSPK